MAKILVIDDDQSILDLLEKIIESAGHQVIPMLSPHKAITQIEKNETFDLIIVDLMMPKMNGHQFIEHVNEHFPHFTTPILVLSADQSENAYSDSIYHGAIDFIKKPIDNSLALIRKIERHLNEKN